MQLTLHQQNLRLKTNNYEDLAAIKLGKRGLGCWAVFPTTWHESKRAWFSLDLLFIYLAVSLPWPWLAPNYHQCDGPRFGFSLSRERLWLCWGQDTGRTADTPKSLRWNWPWCWKFDRRGEEGVPETHPIHYVDRNGNSKEAVSAITPRQIFWKRLGWPMTKVETHITVSFYKGPIEDGTNTSSFALKDDETIPQAIERMKMAL